MKKEFTTVTSETKDERGNIIEAITTEFVSLIAEPGKKIRQISTGITGTRVDIGTMDSEGNYEEIIDATIAQIEQDYRDKLAAEVQNE